MSRKRRKVYAMYQRYTELRDAAGVTDYEVSKQTGISTSTLTSWKYGRYVPKLNKILSLAKYFGVTVDYFTNEPTESPEKPETVPEGK